MSHCLKQTVAQAKQSVGCDRDTYHANEFVTDEVRLLYDYCFLLCVESNVPKVLSA